jgi:hypothetical protein
VTPENGTPAAARPIISCWSCGLVRNCLPSGTSAAAHHAIKGSLLSVVKCAESDSRELLDAHTVLDTERLDRTYLNATLGSCSPAGRWCRS